MFRLSIHRAISKTSYDVHVCVCVYRVFKKYSLTFQTIVIKLTGSAENVRFSCASARSRIYVVYHAPALYFGGVAMEFIGDPPIYSKYTYFTIDKVNRILIEYYVHDRRIIAALIFIIYN